MERYKKMAAMLSSEFDRYLLRHASVAKKLPPHALVVFQVAGEEGFNRWSKRLAIKYREPNQEVVFVKVKSFQTTSALKDVMLERVAV